MKEFLSSLQAKGSLAVVKQKISPNLEVSAVLNSLQGEAVLFENVDGSSLRLAGNLYCKRENLELGLNIKTGTLMQRIQESVRHPAATKGQLSDFKKADWSFVGDADLTKLPVLMHFPKEAGYYLTAGIVVARFPNTETENLSFHRMLMLSKNKVAARLVPRHLNQIAKDAQKKKIPVSVVIGPPPSVFLASSLQIEYGSSEYNIANALAEGSLKLSRSEQSDIAVPVDSEVVLEGYIDFEELVDEGPFVDLTGTYDEVRKQPVITLQRMRYRTDSVYQTVLASTLEHSLFMGLPQELRIIEALAKSIPGVHGINLTPSSGGYFHCIISIDKGNDGDGKTAILNCFAASHPLKLVVAVDRDVNPFDLKQVEWALTTRFQADTGVVLLKGARGSSLDPSSGKSAVTSKLGLDATLPVKKDRNPFERATIKNTQNVDEILRQIGFSNRV
ncbi:MAG: UbiD family decarboxylase [Nitrososphaerota archaeon]|nr:UbiD family decarboxylase [Nitrososphaerota archaeon]MDG6923570.1 UbiD family decarboxylase [Nitrososphaerota archaeon]